MKKYIERDPLIEALDSLIGLAIICKGIDAKPDPVEMLSALREDVKTCSTADVVEEENILKFYYVRSINEYWIGQRTDNFYYAEYDFKSRQWVWTHSRYLPWGEHVVSPTSLWKEHTYPSEPEEIPFAEWLQGFIKKHAADVRENVRGEWMINTTAAGRHYTSCSICSNVLFAHTDDGVSVPLDIRNSPFCPVCGAAMRKGAQR